MLRAILVDDEKPALDLLEKLLSATGHFGNVGMFTKPDEAVEWLKKETVDIVFLDIEMPVMNGIETAEHIMAIDPGIDIVFVTAYNQYAIDAFEVNAVDYVLKPTTAGRLGKTIERILLRRGASVGGREYASTVPTGKSRFHCFSRFEWICDPESPVTVKWRTSKERELMAYLVHHRNAFVTKEKILEDVWAGSNPEQAVVFLHTCIYGIRKKLGSIGCKHLLEFRNNSYRLEVSGLWCDAEEFERAVSGRKAVSPVSIDDFNRIAGLYTGNYMEEDGFVWVHEAQEKFKDAYIGLMKRMTECYLSMKEPRAAADCLRRALEKNPFLDDINEILLKVYADMGDRLSMVRHYKQFTKLLQEELGIAPLKSTVQLYTRLCSGNVDEESKA
ncbi:response regulator [Paenibacillus rigui]|uniref:Response regulatory domain-containing protein n=1 Tax=Paenibacillus rigui TaxID=554312 RepID=A0A229UJB2_9BACL|nr:response regulator [Paenibacillus rigui]OXM82989.1 hypothetical protein CF651_27605 [Paenibacillus rigui]